MIKGFYSGASAMVAGMERQNALAFNIANLETPGFRKAMITAQEWYVTPVRQASQNIKPEMPVDTVLRQGYIGLGVETPPEIIDFTQGTVKSTDEELDFAVNGTGFFRVKTPDGERYTRDGRFLKDASGNLTTIDGFFVLDNNGAQIKLPDAPVRVGQDGAITNALTGAAVGTIGLAAFKDPQAELTRDGNNAFAAEGGITGTTPGKIEQGYLEMSNASASQMLAGARAYEAAQKVVQMNDEITGKLISNLNRP